MRELFSILSFPRCIIQKHLMVFLVLSILHPFFPALKQSSLEFINHSSSEQSSQSADVPPISPTIERQLLLQCFAISILLLFTQNACTGPRIVLQHESKLLPREQTSNTFFTHFKDIIFPEPLQYETERVDLLSIAHFLTNEICIEFCPDLTV